MELNEYQQKAMTTCTESSRNFSYMFINLVGEIGEFASKVAKWIRKDIACIEEESELWFSGDDLPADIEELKKEAGDILWQLSGLCKVMGWTLEEVAQMNLDKLQDRKKRDVIVGEGDNR